MTDTSKSVSSGRFRTSFYGIISIVIFALAMTGFSSTYFTPMARGDFTHHNPYIHIHAAIGTLWLLTYIVQTHLVANGNFNLHIRLGKAGALLALVFVITGVLTFHFMVVHGIHSENEAHRFNAEVIGFAPFSDLISFSLLIGFALAKRRKPNVHKRLIYLASCLFVGPSAFRLVGWIIGAPPTPENGGLAIPVIVTLFFAAGPLYDKLSTGKVDRTYWWALPVWLIAFAGIPLSIATGFWTPIAQWIAAL